MRSHAVAAATTRKSRHPVDTNMTNHLYIISRLTQDGYLSFREHCILRSLALSGSPALNEAITPFYANNNHNESLSSSSSSSTLALYRAYSSMVSSSSPSSSSMSSSHSHSHSHPPPSLWDAVHSLRALAEAEAETRFQSIFAHVSDIDIKSTSRRERDARNLLSDPSLTYGEVCFTTFVSILRSAMSELRTNPHSADVTPTTTTTTTSNTTPNNNNQHKSPVFVDLGSGAGKAVIAASLLFGFRHVIGIELLEGLHLISEESVRRFFAQHAAQDGSSMMRSSSSSSASSADGMQVFAPFPTTTTTSTPTSLELPIIDLFRATFLPPFVTATIGNKHTATASQTPASCCPIDWPVMGDVIFANSTCFSDAVMSEIASQVPRMQHGAILITFTRRIDHPHVRTVAVQKYTQSWGAATVFLCRVGHPPVNESLSSGSSVALAKQLSSSSPPVTTDDNNTVFSPPPPLPPTTTTTKNHYIDTVLPTTSATSMTPMDPVMMRDGSTSPGPLPTIEGKEEAERESPLRSMHDISSTNLEQYGDGPSEDTDEVAQHNRSATSTMLARSSLLFSRASGGNNTEKPFAVGYFASGKAQDIATTTRNSTHDNNNNNNNSKLSQQSHHPRPRIFMEAKIDTSPPPNKTHGSHTVAGWGSRNPSIGLSANDEVRDDDDDDDDDQVTQDEDEQDDDDDDQTRESVGEYNDEGYSGGIQAVFAEAEQAAGRAAEATIRVMLASPSTRSGGASTGGMHSPGGGGMKVRPSPHEDNASNRKETKKVLETSTTNGKSTLDINNNISSQNNHQTEGINTSTATNATSTIAFRSTSWYMLHAARRGELISATANIWENDHHDADDSRPHKNDNSKTHQQNQQQSSNMQKTTHNISNEMIHPAASMKPRKIASAVAAVSTRRETQQTGVMNKSDISQPEESAVGEANILSINSPSRNSGRSSSYSHRYDNNTNTNGGTNPRPTPHGELSSPQGDMLMAIKRNRGDMALAAASLASVANAVDGSTDAAVKIASSQYNQHAFPRMGERGDNAPTTAPLGTTQGTDNDDDDGFHEKDEAFRPISSRIPVKGQSSKQTGMLDPPQARIQRASSKGSELSAVTDDGFEESYANFQDSSSSSMTTAFMGARNHNHNDHYSSHKGHHHNPTDVPTFRIRAPAVSASASYDMGASSTDKQRMIRAAELDSPRQEASNPPSSFPSVAPPGGKHVVVGTNPTSNSYIPLKSNGLFPTSSLAIANNSTVVNRMNHRSGGAGIGEASADLAKILAGYAATQAAQAAALVAQASSSGHDKITTTTSDHNRNTSGINNSGPDSSSSSPTDSIPEELPVSLVQEEPHDDDDNDDDNDDDDDDHAPPDNHRNWYENQAAEHADDASIPAVSWTIHTEDDIAAVLSSSFRERKEGGAAAGDEYDTDEDESGNASITSSTDTDQLIRYYNDVVSGIHRSRPRRDMLVKTEQQQQLQEYLGTTIRPVDVSTSLEDILNTSSTDDDDDDDDDYATSLAGATQSTIHPAYYTSLPSIIIRQSKTPPRPGTIGSVQDSDTSESNVDDEQYPEADGEVEEHDDEEEEAAQRALLRAVIGTGPSPSKAYLASSNTQKAITTTSNISTAKLPTSERAQQGVYAATSSTNNEMKRVRQSFKRGTEKSNEEGAESPFGDALLLRKADQQQQQRNMGPLRNYANATFVPPPPAPPLMSTNNSFAVATDLRRAVLSVKLHSEKGKSNSTPSVSQTPTNDEADTPPKRLDFDDYDAQAVSNNGVRKGESSEEVVFPVKRNDNNNNNYNFKTTTNVVAVAAASVSRRSGREAAAALLLADEARESPVGSALVARKLAALAISLGMSQRGSTEEEDSDEDD